MHRWTIRVYPATISSHKRVDPIVVDITVEHFEPAPPVGEADIVVVPSALVQTAHDHDIVPDTFDPALELSLIHI